MLSFTEKKCRTIDLVAKVAGVNGRYALLIVRKMQRNEHGILLDELQTKALREYGVSVKQIGQVQSSVQYLAGRYGTTTGYIIEDAAQDDNRPPTAEEAQLCHYDYMRMFEEDTRCAGT